MRASLMRARVRAFSAEVDAGSAQKMRQNQKALNCSLLQEIADLPQQYLLGRWRRRWRRLLFPMESIDLLHNDENREGDDEETDQGVDEETVVHGHRPRRLRRIDGGKAS